MISALFSLRAFISYVEGKSLYRMIDAEDISAYYNLIRRGIEAVITGLTRNQFVDNTTRGFESLPLRQKMQLHHLV